MRTWRVGSISMGATLLLLGLLLLLTQLLHLDTTTVLLAWWPVILIILGIEILFYLLFSKQEKTNVKYDFLSIIFVGFIGMIGISLTVLTTTGVLEKVNEWANIETNTMDLPEYKNLIGKEIKRVVLDTGSHEITIENSPDDGVSIFGTYLTQTMKNKATIKSVKDYLLVKEKGDTLYVSFKEIYNLPQPFQDRVDMNVIFLIPTDIKLEVKGSGNRLTLKPRNLLGDWSVNGVSDVDVLLADETNILIKAKNVYDLNGDGWHNNGQGEKHIDEETPYSSMMKVGAGAHTLTINDAQFVSVTKQ